MVPCGDGNPQRDTRRCANAAAPTAAQDVAGDEAGAEQRIANQAVLTGDTTRRFVMLMPEGSLGWALVPPVRMADQVRHIAAMSRRRNMRIGIIPWGRVSSVLPLHSWEIYDGDAYLELFATLERLAVYGDDAREVLTRVADRYQELCRGG